MKNTTVLRRLSVPRLGLAALAVAGAAAVPSNAHAQVAGTSGRPLPNVLLLVDNSGSMERVPDTGKEPTCNPGVQATPDNINRWAMLLQALTGNFQPYYSCQTLTRNAVDPVTKFKTDFANRYSIAGQNPYDTDYFLAYHAPLTGTNGDACVMAPWRLPGVSTGAGVGINALGHPGVTADKYPDDAIVAYKANKVGGGVPEPLKTDDMCTFDQNNDGQLDVATQYARFALMTFDSLVEKETGVTGGIGAWQVAPDPFKGNWSYLRHTGNEFFDAIHSDASGAAIGAPPACSPTVQEVGARNAGAPPWEGRLVRFANPEASIYELAAQNQLIQQTLLATRPYGATPIDGMMDDARDYFYNDPEGPSGLPAWKDPYTCRDKYIILLTDGAPNLDLRPSCASSGTFPSYTCPYPRQAGDIADQMFTATGDKKITTFVIGFSVNGVNVTTTNDDGFPHALADKNCKSWFKQASLGATDPKVAAQNMKLACQTAPVPGPGTTGEACCKLNDIALQGSGQGAFFAESQADVVLAFGRIMANIIHSASTKAIPAFSPISASSAYTSSSTAKASAAEFIASYVPASQTPWSGELDRTRFKCDAMTNTSQPVGLDHLKGDLQSENLAAQTSGGKRLFISVVGDKLSGQSALAIDSSASIRPFVVASSTGGDQIGVPGGAANLAPYKGTEVVMKGYSNLRFNSDWPLALNVTKSTCKRGRAVKTKVAGAGIAGTEIIPALDGPTGEQDCTDVVWGFATATPSPLSFTGSTGLPAPKDQASYNFNVRCSGGGVSTSGTCSISGNPCVPQNNLCPIGEACIPQCAALGAVYHGSPTVFGPPSSTLREDGYRQYQKAKATRRPVLYAATTDGILHAFDALREAAQDSNHELWNFVPPAVLPHLASNYPGGNQILLDGAPVVRDIVWDRKTTAAPDGKQWHSVLVGGVGTYPGYYALNVTDADCSAASTDLTPCYTGYQTPSYDTVADVSNSGDVVSPTPAGKKGPHFLWQLTDVPADDDPNETKVTRSSPIGTTAKNSRMAGLFGKNTGTPAIGMATIKTASDGDHQIGIAVLPGGYDDPPIADGQCARYTPQPSAMTDTYTAARTNVRQWAKGGCGSPVTGRNVTIVRADSGEVIRVFGRKLDVPRRLWSKLAGNGYTESFLDSPMVGTPVMYPDLPGVPVQKIFIGDADGTLWKIDLTSTDPKDWKIYLFADLLSQHGTGADASKVSQPIAVPPVLSTADNGELIVNAATGDQESIIYNDSINNYVWSIRDGKDGSTPKGVTQWYRALGNHGERVTGPMTVFDKTLYFASFAPGRPSGAGASCDNLGTSFLWGLNYVTPQTASLNSGGKWAWCPDLAADGTGCSGTITDRAAPPTGEHDIIPGVVLHQSQACVVDSGGTDEWGSSAISSTSSSSYTLYFGVAKPMAPGAQTQALRGSTTRPMPKISTQISSWSLVLE